VEYVGQVRAWFYVMHVLATALFKRNSFKNVVVTGVMAGNDGRKMSKTYNNYADPKMILETLGGDAVRLYLMGSPLMVGENANFDEVELRNKSRNVLNPLLNSARFFVMYADLYKWNASKIVTSKNLLDKWIMARLNQTIESIAISMESYTIPATVQLIECLVDDLSRWYVRRSRDRISKGDNEALSTLFYVLLNFSKACAPLIPFISENIYRLLRNYGGDSLTESVHLCDYPSYDKTPVKMELLAGMKTAREIVSLGHALRIENKISVRQPLRTAVVIGSAKPESALIDIIRDELNVKNVEFSTTNWSSGLKVTLDLKITEELKLEGLTREMIRQLQDLRKDSNLSITDTIDAVFINSPENIKVVKKFGEEIKKKVLAETLVPGSTYEIRKKS
jgi:isoleucyl-tRNA synthetase